MKTKNIIETELIDEGFNINVHRFPYTYHHDYVKKHLMSRSDVAIRLRDICVDDNQYDYSVCYGTILYLVSEQPEKITTNVCDIFEYVKERSIYNINGCTLNQMRDILKI